MHRSLTYTLGVEEEEKRDHGGKKAGTSLSGRSLLSGDGSEREVYASDYRHENGNGVGIEEGFYDDNPWISVPTTSTATLRSRQQHQRKEPDREIGYVYDGEHTRTNSNGYLHEHRPQSETRRRRRSRSAAAGTSKHPLYLDADGEGHSNVNIDGYSDGHRSSLSSKSPFSSPYPPESSSTLSFADHQTRPSLRRAIGSLEGRMDLETDEGSKGSAKSDNEVDVVVHKIMRTDTLAGISLKYNIPLAQLRKANKLWTNDSIHLRDVLYIPLRDVSSPLSLSNILPSNSNSAFNSKSSSYTNLRDTVPTPGAQSEIHKVASSRLFFFPPSGGLNPTSISSSRSQTNTLQRTSPTFTPHIRPIAFGSPPFSLASLLQGLNSASHEIKSRLSLDDSKHSSETGEEGREIEMDPVKNSNRSDGSGMDGAFPVLNPFSVSPYQQHSVPITTLTSTPTKTVIRSIQLQPSPKMVIPTAMARDKGGGRLRGLQNAVLDSDTE